MITWTIDWLRVVAWRKRGKTIMYRVPSAGLQANWLRLTSILVRPRSVARRRVVGVFWHAVLFWLYILHTLNTLFSYKNSDTHWSIIYREDWKINSYGQSIVWLRTRSDWVQWSWNLALLTFLETFQRQLNEVSWCNNFITKGVGNFINQSPLMIATCYYQQCYLDMERITKL